MLLHFWFLSSAFGYFWWVRCSWSICITFDVRLAYGFRRSPCFRSLLCRRVCNTIPYFFCLSIISICFIPGFALSQICVLENWIEMLFFFFILVYLGDNSVSPISIQLSQSLGSLAESAYWFLSSNFKYKLFS